MSVVPGRLVLLGHPVAHSLSPHFQNAALRHCGLPLAYEALDVPPATLDQIIEELRRENGAGNVTVPHKVAMAARCDRLTAAARQVGAVNVFWFDESALVGDNTDVGGFVGAAEALAGGRIEGVRIALLGAGGAAAAVAAGVSAWPRCTMVVANRSIERAAGLQQRFPLIRAITTDTVAAVRDADVVVNATTIGMDDGGVPVSIEEIAPHALLLDLVYRRGGTRWVREARARGMRADDGTAMLVEQGALAFERWFDVPAPREVMRAAIESAT
ncbi:MAG TPA: shikimate dehydrogenase [Gemmatimonadaceae bacterium]|nr:shikimate dehydrogenase [Gemmatimonadaceae bacterium]